MYDTVAASSGQEGVRPRSGIRVTRGVRRAAPRPFPGDWRHAAEAQERLAIADHAAAEALLTQVPAQGEAARNAGILRGQLTTTAMTPARGAA